MSARIVPTAAGPWNSPEERADRARYWRERAAHYRKQADGLLVPQQHAREPNLSYYKAREAEARKTADMCEERAVKLEQP